MILSFQSNAQLLKVELSAIGLTCSMCSKAMYNQLNCMNDIDSIGTNISQSKFIIKLKKNNSLTPNIFKEKVEKAGSFIGSFVATAPANLISNSAYVLLNTNNSDSEFIRFQVLDKGFVSIKEYKKLAKEFKNSQTYLKNNKNDFHIKIIYE